MTDFDLSKITGREPPVETDEDMVNALADALGDAEALRIERDALRARVKELEAQLLEHSEVCKEGPRPLTQQARDAAHYYELLYAVGKKYPGETRHETALRYIRQAEASSDDRLAGSDTAALSEGK